MKKFTYYCLSLAALSVAAFFLIGSYYLLFQVPKYEKVWYEASDGWQTISHSINNLTEPMRLVSQDMHALRAISDEALALMGSMDQSMQALDQSVEQIPPHLDRLSYDVHQMQRNTDYKPDRVFRRMMP